MFNWRRWISILLVCCLLLPVGSLSGCGRKEDAPPSEAASVSADPSASAGPSDSFPGGMERPLVPGPEDFVTEWTGDVAMPFINPYGMEERYADIRYETDGETGFAHIDRNNRMKEPRPGGSVWYLDVAEAGSLEAFRLRMATHAFAKGLEELAQPEDDQWMARGVDATGTVWWAQAEYGGEQCRITVLRERRLVPDTPLVIRTEDFENGGLHFTIDHTGTDFLSLKAEFEQGSIDLDGRVRSGVDSYVREVAFRADVMEAQGNRFLFDGLPQDPGLQSWILYWQDPVPETVTLTLYASAPLRQVNIRETLGAIRVRNASFGAVRAVPYLGAETWLAHPEYSESSLSGDVTPEGDVVLWLPPGYWDVLVEPAQEWLGTCRTCLVPVQSGMETVVTLPGSLQAAYAPRAAEPGTDRGMEILAAKDNGAKAEIIFTLSDRETQGILPDTLNTTILEGGAPGTLLSVERVETPPHVVLLLDSSGSMKGQMEKTVEAARAFVGGLPDNAAITVVDFDTSARVLKGTTKSEALTGLKTVKANGATALYDSVALGLELLAESDRPTLILFTDGVDANLDDSGPGSAATREDILGAVVEAGIPLYTIGFGKGHDVATLDVLARQSGGRYFPADNQQALTDVFSAIAAKLGNTFRAVYERSVVDTSGDVPVLSLVLDSSGSMDMDPSTEGCGFRLHRVRNLFHEFILNLPEDMLMQITAFDDGVSVTQMLTSDKAELLAGLNLVDADGGTNIHGAADAAYETLKAIPSTRKAIVVLTDAALDVPDKEAFAHLLGRIREDGIQILWAGIGLDEEEAVFAQTAELSGGAYVLTEDPDVLGGALADLMGRVRAMPPSEGTALRLLVNKRSETGELFAYSAGALAAFSPPPGAKGKTDPETVRIAYGERFSQYEPAMADLVYGTDVPMAETRVAKRIPLHVTGRNEALAWTVHEAVVLDALRGLEAPSGMRFLGLHTTLENRMPVQEVVVYPDGSGHPSAWISGDGAAQGVRKKVQIPYLIPDLAAHVFLQTNNTGQSPVSPVTWLAETPLVPPGEMALLVQPDAPLAGMMLFLIPDGATTQMSLHLYDTDYGHIATPLTGVMATLDTMPERLPKSVGTRLSDAFSLTVNAYAQTKAIGAVEAETGSVFRVLEGELASRVQALLEMDPAERFMLRIPTDKGDFWMPNHPATVLLPFGFRKPAVLAPGSKNTFRMAFQVPEAVNGLPAQLYTELQGADVVTSVSGLPKPMTRIKGAYRGDGMTLEVNGVYRAERVAGQGGAFVVADVTVFDEADGMATAGVSGVFTLQADAVGEASGEAGAETEGAYAGWMEVSSLTDDMLLGFGTDAIVPDGAQRRGFVVFEPDNPEAAWRLRSSWFPGLDLPVADTLLDERWTVAVTPVEDEDEWGRLCAQALGEAVLAHESRQAAEAAAGGRTSGEAVFHHEVPRGDLDGRTITAARVPVPALTLFGHREMADVATLTDLEGALRSLRWIPDGRTWLSGYAPEATLTQGWGTEGDLMRVAEQGLSKLGYSPRRRTVSVTDEGRRALAVQSGVPDTKGSWQLPSLSWLDESGQERLLVIPFMKDLSDLHGLCWLPAGAGFEERREEPECQVRVFAEAISQAVTVGSQMGSMADALGGDESGERESEEVLMLETRMGMPLLSLDALDLGFTVTGQGKGAVIAAWLDGPFGTQPGQWPIDSGSWKVIGFKMVITPAYGNEIVHRYALAEGEALPDVFVTYGIQLPDLPEPAVVALESASDAVRKDKQTADDLSALKWFTRGILNRFISGQTRYEAETAAALGIVSGRTATSRCVAVTVHRTAGKVRTGMDLLQSVSDVHNGEGDARLAAQAFRSATGFLATALEAEVLPGDGMGLLEIWGKLPKGANYVVLSPTARTGAAADFKGAGMPQEVQDRLLQAESNVWVLIPDKPARIGGRDRWAWLEMKENGETVGVLDTGAHGGMVEVSLQDWVNEANMFIVGGLVGITSSIWTVSAFSLELDDYGDILKKAKAAALGVQKAFGFNQGPAGYGVGGLPEISGSSHGIKASLGSGGITLSQDVLGFGNGYAAGVDYYFSKAK